MTPSQAVTEDVYDGMADSLVLSRLEKEKKTEAFSSHWNLK